MTAPTNIREAKWRALSAQVTAVLDTVEARTDFGPTLELARRYRKRLTERQKLIDSTDHSLSRDAALSIGLSTFGINGMWPAICGLEQQARFHGVTRPALPNRFQRRI